MSKKIAIFAPYATVAPHFEAELEIAQQHLDAGDEVTFYSCTGQLANCDFNIDRDPERCENCVGRRQHGHELLDGRVRTVQLSGGPVSVPKFGTVDELIGYRVESFDVGYGALSSLVSVCRDPEPDLEKYAALLERFISSALTTFRETLDYIRRERPDRVYVFNGRFAAMRAVFRACQQENVECFLHERGCDLNHYDLYENHLPHDIAGIDAVIRRLWNEADPASRESVGASWYEDRVNRVERNWQSFTKEQQAGLLPVGFDASQRNVAIFCSSDDEFVAIGDAWRNTLYPNQVQAIAAICESMLQSAPATKIYLRVHPNLKDVDNQRKREMLALDYSNLHVIAPDAAIDTYALMHASDLTVSFGSSVGMEAVFWGKPSVLLGPCLYQDLGGPVRSHSHSQTIELLCRDLQAADSPPADRTGALMYGHWFQVRGYRYEYFAAENLFEGKFKGQVVHDRAAAKLAAKKKRSKFFRLTGFA